jgi:cytoskeleton protein RodZ
MESIGEKLKTKREELGYSIEQIARETNIAKRYIEALEVEDFDVFPGEPYLIGFLRTYSEYLGLKSDEIIGLYKNFKIQEQPVPMEELIEKKSRGPLGLIIVAVIIVGGLITAGIIFLPNLLSLGGGKDVAAAGEQTSETIGTEGTMYEMNDEILERRFLEGDSVMITFNGDEAPVRLLKVDDELTLKTSIEETTLKLGEEKRLDLNGDGKEDILVYLRDLENEEEQRSAVLRFDKFTQVSVARATGGDEERPPTDRLGPESGEQEGPSAEGDTQMAAASLGSTDVNTRRQALVVVEEASQPEPFTLNMVFRGYCLLRYVSDDRVREERYFHKGETFRLEASRRVRLWLSNAGSVKTDIAGEDVTLGRPGEVVTKLIMWNQDEASGQYQLQVIPVY